MNKSHVDISIIVPTFRRPQQLLIALASVRNDLQANPACELIVVDNDPAASAKDAAAQFSKNLKDQVTYVHAPTPGVSHARNAAMKAAAGRYIAFLDDDMEAKPGWLTGLVSTSKTYNAAIVFGPVHAYMPGGDKPAYAYMKPFFSRSMDAPEGIIQAAFGTGGCLLDLSLCELPSPVFNTDLNETGGEDDFLFDHLIARGAIIAWSPDAQAIEHVPEHRATAAYMWTRNFAFGQGPSQSEADKGVSGSLGVIKWMIIGILQAAIFAPVYKFLQLIHHPSYVIYLAKTAQGIGKILWWNNFSPKLYGADAPEHKAT